MTSPPPSGWLDVTGGKLWYETAGRGPPILFLHAAIADRRQWDREFARYAPTHTVVRFDVRGLGRSPPATAPYSDVEDVAALVRHLRLAPAVVVGCSNGGRLALDFALEHPESVRGLLLLANGLSGWGPEMDPEGEPVYRSDMARSAGIGEAWKAGRSEEALAKLREYWCSATPAPARPLVEAMMRENAGEIFTDASARFAQPIARPAATRMGEIRVPTRILYGDRDEPTMGYIVGRTAKGIPGAIYEPVPGADHLINLSQPAAFDRALLDLLGR